jgi:hypothetical protein
LDRGRWRHRHCGTWRSEKRDEHDKRSGPHSRRHKHLAVSFRQIHAKRRANNKCCQPYSRYQSRARRRYCPRMKTRRFRACGRQYGSCPETGLGDINGDLPEADFWPGLIPLWPVTRTDTGYQDRARREGNS